MSFAIAADFPGLLALLLPVFVGAFLGRVAADDLPALLVLPLLVVALTFFWAPVLACALGLSGGLAGDLLLAGPAATGLAGPGVDRLLGAGPRTRLRLSGSGHDRGRLLFAGARHSDEPVRLSLSLGCGLPGRLSGLVGEPSGLSEQFGGTCEVLLCLLAGLESVVAPLLHLGVGLLRDLRDGFLHFRLGIGTRLGDPPFRVLLDLSHPRVGLGLVLGPNLLNALLALDLGPVCLLGQPFRLACGRHRALLGGLRLIGRGMRALEAEFDGVTKSG